MTVHRSLMHTLDVGSILAGLVVSAGYITPIGGALLVLCGLVVYGWRFWQWLKPRLASKAG